MRKNWIPCTVLLTTACYTANVVILFSLQEKTLKRELGVLLRSQEKKKGFPVTRFTAHVQELVDLYDFAAFHKIDRCNNGFNFYLADQTKNESVPRIECIPQKTSNPVQTWWCKVLKEIIFSPGRERTLPYNVSFGVSMSDFSSPERDGYGCLGNSAKDGNFTITNFLEIYRMSINKSFDVIPWDKRSKTPVWRGTPWVFSGVIDWKNKSGVYQQVLRTSPRLKAVDWSMQHPSLLDARVHRRTNDMEMDPNWFPNATYGLHNLIASVDPIPEDKYYSQYQVALVLCGIGAAFRTSIHLSTSTAVVLHTCTFEEWFTRLMIPFEHYIPLAEDLSDIDEKMNWIREHPSEVRAIAENGRQFYEQYLSFKRNEEHIYEFIYRLALAKAQYSGVLASTLKDHDGGTATKMNSEEETEQEENHPGLREAGHNQYDRHRVVAPISGIGFIDDPTLMCRELLARANGTVEGDEPWRASEGLYWTTNDCMDQGLSVLGNHLSRWYMERAIASAAHVSLEMVCHSPLTDRIQNIVAPSDTVLDGDTGFSWKSFCQSCVSGNDGNCKYPHGVRSNGLDRVASAIKSDLSSMAERVIATSARLLTELDDVTIHLRCGDIGRQDHGLYGLFPFKVYSKLIPKTATSIGIVTAPFDQHRAGWGPGDPQLNKAVATAAKSFIQGAFPNAIVSIRNDDRDTHDIVFVRLMMANHTICGSSTFCLFPALASKGKSYIFHSPLYGGHPTWLDTVAESSGGRVHYIDEKFIPSSEIWKLNVTDIVKMLM